ncbi:tetratricopeptide repeat protein, partial [bacterium]|nr:tetratricopeptide repeat protein [bacterium]
RRIADAHIELQQWKQAAAVIEKYLNAKTLETKDAEVIYQLGELYHQAGEATLAARRKKQAFDLALHAVGKPTKALSDAQLHLLLAELYYADDKPEKALEYLLVTRQLDPKDSKKALLVAAAQKRVQQWKQAADTYRAFLKDDPSSLAAAGAFIELAECHEVLGEMGRATGSRQAAIDILDRAYRAVQADQAKAAVKLELGQLALRRNQPQRAVEHFLDALALNPKRHAYHLGLAQAYQVQADWKRAAAHYQSYIAGFDDPSSPEAAAFIYRLGVAQARSGQAELGRKNKQRAIRILESTLNTLEKESRGTPAYKAELLRDLASLQAGEKQHAKAIATIAKAIAIAPPGKRASYRLFLASVHEEMKQYAECERVLLDEHRRKPDSPDVCNHLGYFYAEQGKKLDEAVKLVQKALHYEPLNGAYLDSLGWAYYKQGQLEKARDLLSRALRYEEDAVIRDHLGDAFLKLGQIDKAREAWATALAQDPDIPSVRQKLQKHKAPPTPQAPPKPKGGPAPAAPPKKQANANTTK